LNHSNKLIFLTTLGSLLFILSACQSTPPPITPTPDTTAPSAKTTADDVYTPQQLDIESPVSQLPTDFPLVYRNDDFRLQQAASLFNAGRPGPALDMLDSIEDGLLTSDQRTRKRIMQAAILLQAGGNTQAQQLLNAEAESYQTTTLAVFYLIRAKALLAQGQTADALNALITRQQFVAGNVAEENQRLIWNVVMFLNDRQLRMIQQTDISAELAGWIELATAIREKNVYENTEQVINNWRTKNFSHPASAAVLAQISSDTISTTPTRIAFLLPLTSAYEPAASAIRDGFEAMNNEQLANHRYQLRLYDYGRDANAAMLYYNQAVNDGAEVIVGPLGRQSINSLLTSAEIKVPTILLSPAEEQSDAPQNLFQFSLSQELEAQQAAQRAWIDGYRRGVILYPQTDIGQRMAAAFTDRFNQLGGKIVNTENYAAMETDISPSVRRMLGVDSSEQRIAEMKRLLGRKITAEARRRQDIDFIFLPATNRKARLIKPLLDFFYAFDLPIYSTSRIFSGKVDPVNDRDLDRIRFPDMPWMIATNIELESLRTFLQGGWPNRETSYNRLYGLGMDIFSILPLIERMRENPMLHFQGMSGNLSIDENGIIHREMLWASFRKGSPALLDKQPTYQGRFSEKRYEAVPAITPASR
jgi:outer membrane PBP1 activator LpoA protein